MPRAKPCDKITPEDLAKHSVWTFDLGNEGRKGQDETWMVPVDKLPARSLDGCGCSANATLACGRKIEAMLWGIDLKSSEVTECFIAIAFWLDQEWWHLSNGGISDEAHEPSDLASKLGLELEDVFPITYDVSGWVAGPKNIVCGHIPAERRKLTMEERIALALRST